MLICHREEIQAPEMQDNTAAALSPFCAILPALFSDKCAHAAGSLAFSSLMPGNKHNIKVSSCCTEGETVSRKDVSSPQEGLRVPLQRPVLTGAATDSPAL